MKWHEKPINVIVLTILFWPLGLYYMWTNKMFFFKNKTLSKDSQSEPKPSDIQTVSSGSETSEEKSQTIQENKPEEQIEKKVENVDKSIKKLDEKLKTDESTESVEETSSDELKELEELKDAGILTEEEFQQKKEEILSQDSTISQIEEETTPDKIVCDFCGGKLINNSIKGCDSFVEIYGTDDDDREDKLSIWCLACINWMYILKDSLPDLLNFELPEISEEDDEEHIWLCDYYDIIDQKDFVLKQFILWLENSSTEDWNDEWRL